MNVVDDTNLDKYTLFSAVSFVENDQPLLKTLTQMKSLHDLSVHAFYRSVHGTEFKPAGPEKKECSKKAFQALTMCSFIHGAPPPLPAKTTFTSKQPGPSKNEKKSSKLNLHLPMQLQHDNSSSISNNDVIAVLKQSLQSLESFKQEVQMLKEVQR